MTEKVKFAEIKPGVFLFCQTISAGSVSLWLLSVLQSRSGKMGELPL